MPVKTINPATGMLITTYSDMSMSIVTPQLQALDVAQKIWANTSFSIRAEKMNLVSKILLKDKVKFGQLMATEMGKPISAAIAEVEKCALVCAFYAKEAANYLKPRSVTGNYKKAEVIYQPLGIIFAIMPWNFPFWQVFRFAAPNLMSGNAGLLNHAPIVTGCALAIEKIFQEAGIDVFKSIIIDYDVSKKIIEHPLIKAVTLTGSERAGKVVGANAASALKKVVLELGGSDPYIVLADADIDNAADSIVKSRMNNTGQVCIAAKRIIIEASIYEEMLEKIFEKMKSYVMGDPLDPKTNLGPLARDDIRAGVHQQVLASVQKGARLICGGEIPNREGFYYPPTLLDNVKPGMPAFDDEIFGPVISLIKAKDEDEALILANQTRFGLAAAVFTRNIEKGEKFARAIEAGTCAINGFVRSDPLLPFGGIKASGYGRELAIEGMHEFMNIKTITIAE